MRARIAVAHLAFSFTFALAFAHHAYAEVEPIVHEDFVKLTPEKDAPSDLIQFESTTLPLYEYKEGRETTYKTKIRAKRLKKLGPGSLVVNYLMAKNQDPVFIDYWVDIEKPETEVLVYHVDNYGQIKKENYTATVSKWALLTPPTLKKNKWAFSTTLGLTSISYEQSNYRGSPSALASTIKGTVEYRFLSWEKFKEWSTGLTVFYNFANLSNTDGALTFLGMDYRIGSAVNWLPAPWKLSLNGGVYYLSMFASSNRFGFRDVGGPLLLPMIRYELNNGGILGSYFKFAPVSQGFGFLGLDSFEIASGVSYSRPIEFIKWAQRWLTAIDISYLKLKLGSVTGHSSTVSLGTGLTF